MNIQNHLAGAASRVGDIVTALRDASAKTGSDFDYLLNTAMRESSLQPHAKSKNSSATGLFQFIDQTWLSLVKRYGERHGLSAYAAAIEQKKGGACTVASAETKAAILALRQNPVLSALMAGEAAREAKQSLECSLGREVNCGELYVAHFLGQGGAKRLIQLKDADPSQAADLAFAKAAQANRPLFYHKDGTAKTVAELYASLVEPKSPKTLPALAAAKPAQPAPANVITLDDDCRLAPTAAASLPHFAAPKLPFSSDMTRGNDVTRGFGEKFFALPSVTSALRLSPATLHVLAALDLAERKPRAAA